MRVGDHALVLAVLDIGEQVGSIEVTLPPGRTLRTFERQLLEDVAAQAGVAFRNALLQAELNARV
jgi:GAF domain-containing protein